MYHVHAVAGLTVAPVLQMTEECVLAIAGWRFCVGMLAHTTHETAWRPTCHRQDLPPTQKQVSQVQTSVCSTSHGCLWRMDGTQAAVLH